MSFWPAWRCVASINSKQALARAWDEGRPDVFFALDRLGRAYLDFARSEPAYYSAMFEAGVPLADNPELRDAGDRAFAVLRAAAEKLCAQVPARDRPPALMVALHIWAMAHGIASLFGRGDAARRALPIAAEELLEAQTLIYLRGLGVASAKPRALISEAGPALAPTKRHLASWRSSVAGLPQQGLRTSWRAKPRWPVAACAER